MLSKKRVRELLHYDPLTGIFTRKLSLNPGTRVGKIAGCKQARYVTIMVDKRRYSAHRLAWLYMTGRWPKFEIDHINGDGHDNRFCNLREATRLQNVKNTRRRKDNTSGFKGVRFHKRIGRWQTAIALNKKYTHLGYFDTPEEAYAAYCKAAEELHGDFARVE